MKQLDNEISCLKEDNNQLRNNLADERNLKTDEQKKNLSLNNLINNQENDLIKLRKVIDVINNMHLKVNEEKACILEENQKLREHIMTLTNQNDLLVNKIKSVLGDSEFCCDNMGKSEALKSSVRNNKYAIEGSLGKLNDYFNGNRGKLNNC